MVDSQIGNERRAKFPDLIYIFYLFVFSNGSNPELLFFEKNYVFFQKRTRPAEKNATTFLMQCEMLYFHLESANPRTPVQC